VPVGHPSEIDEIFDDISYKKGASVIRMLHKYIGDEVNDTCLVTLVHKTVAFLCHIHGVSKKFGEWYQKTNKTEVTNKLTLLVFTVSNVHKATGNCQQRPL
jgi:hypothetical protein